MRLLHFLTGLLLLLFGCQALTLQMHVSVLCCLLAAAGAAEIFFAAAYRKIFASSPRSGPVIRAIVILLLYVTALYFYSSFGLSRQALIIAAFGSVLLFITFLEKQIDRQLYIHIDEEGVSVPAFTGKRHYPWNRVNNVILRDDLLTLDFSGNRLLQLETQTGWDEAQVRQFNSFCQLKIAASAEGASNRD